MATFLQIESLFLSLPEKEKKRIVAADGSFI